MKRNQPFSSFLPVMTAIGILISGCASQQAPNSASQTAPAAQTTNVPVKQAIQRQAIAPALYEIAYSAKQKAVFVASAGGREADAPPPRILRLNPQTLALETEIKLERPGLGLALDDEANRLYVGNAFDGSITIVDTQTNQVTGLIQLSQKQHTTGFDGKPTERYPHNLRELVLDKANKRIFAPGLWINNGALYVASTETLKVEKVIPGFGFGAAGVTLDAQNNKLYVSNMQGQLIQVNTKTLELEKTFEVAADQLLNLTFDQRSKHVLATDHGADNPNMVREKFAKLPYTIRGEGNRVVVINPADGQVLNSVATGRNPIAPLIDQERSRLWVTNRGTGTVTVHDSRSYQLLQTFELPTHPNSLTLNQQTGEVFVTIKNGEKDAKGSSESVAKLSF